MHVDVHERNVKRLHPKVAAPLQLALQLSGVGGLFPPVIAVPTSRIPSARDLPELVRGDLAGGRPPRGGRVDRMERMYITGADEGVDVVAQVLLWDRAGDGGCVAGYIHRTGPRPACTYLPMVRNVRALSLLTLGVSTLRGGAPGP